jgi:hypothetical protein
MRHAPVMVEVAFDTSGGSGANASAALQRASSANGGKDDTEAGAIAIAIAHVSLVVEMCMRRQFVVVRRTLIALFESLKDHTLYTAYDCCAFNSHKAHETRIVGRRT